MSGNVGAKSVIGELKRKRAISPLAAKVAPKEMLVDVALLEREYLERRLDTANYYQLVNFKTSAPRGSPLDGTFTEAHILAITQAICDYRQSHGVRRPLHLSKDTHALSGPSRRTALEVLAGNNSVETILQKDDGVTHLPMIGSPTSSDSMVIYTGVG